MCTRLPKTLFGLRLGFYTMTIMILNIFYGLFMISLGITNLTDPVPYHEFYRYYLHYYDENPLFNDPHHLHQYNYEYHWHRQLQLLEKDILNENVFSPIQNHLKHLYNSLEDIYEHEETELPRLRQENSKNIDILKKSLRCATLSGYLNDMRDLEKYYLTKTNKNGFISSFPSSTFNSNLKKIETYCDKNISTNQENQVTYETLSDFFTDLKVIRYISKKMINQNSSSLKYIPTLLYLYEEESKNWYAVYHVIRKLAYQISVKKARPTLNQSETKYNLGLVDVSNNYSKDSTSEIIIKHINKHITENQNVINNRYLEDSEDKNIEVELKNHKASGDSKHNRENSSSINILAHLASIIAGKPIDKDDPDSWPYGIIPDNYNFTKQHLDSQDDTHRKPILQVLNLIFCPAELSGPVNSLMLGLFASIYSILCLIMGFAKRFFGYRTLFFTLFIIQHMISFKHISQKIRYMHKYSEIEYFQLGPFDFSVDTYREYQFAFRYVDTYLVLIFIAYAFIILPFVLWILYSNSFIHAVYQNIHGERKTGDVIYVPTKEWISKGGRSPDVRKNALRAIGTESPSAKWKPLEPILKDKTYYEVR